MQGCAANPEDLASTPIDELGHDASQPDADLVGDAQTDSDAGTAVSDGDLEEAARPDRPPIDDGRPERFQTATFAYG